MGESGVMGKSKGPSKSQPDCTEYETFLLSFQVSKETGKDYFD